MKECPNCGYERQPRDDEYGIVPSTECPRCRVIYDKAGEYNQGYKRTETISRNAADREKARQSSANSGRAGKSVSLKVVMILIILGLAGGAYYFKKQGDGLYGSVVKTDELAVRVFMTST